MTSETPPHPSAAQTNPLILMDGVCNLCTALVQFLIRHDSKKIFRYTSLQSSTSQKVTHDFKIDLSEIPDTVILIHNSRVYKRSEACIEIFRILGGAWKIISIFKILPVKFRDFCYDYIARNRYRWFGKRDTCYLPTPETRELFLD